MNRRSLSVIVLAAALVLVPWLGWLARALAKPAAHHQHPIATTNEQGALQ